MEEAIILGTAIQCLDWFRWQGVFLIREPAERFPPFDACFVFFCLSSPQR